MNPEPTSAKPAEHAPAQDAGWGGPQPEPSRTWSARKTAIAAAIAVGIAAAGGVTIYAMGGETPAAQGPGGMGGRGPMIMGPGGPMAIGPMREALHGEFVVSDGKGGYKTERTQTGSVTEVSATSITAKSADGFTQVYTIDAATVVSGGSAKIDSVKTGASVTITADTANKALSIVDGAGGRGGRRGN
ncbi:hypothetical protein [Allokutzneria albata]|uniref:DUF5666 domain-containing protein n=1 Tax=Allokutzneria albata TaxID=211114 RepID=A0A1G9RN21_ALLAB|nr:hypothetical protein [Allokutzneria albata]SDM24480.1 hypothetical protein SAMN04489726_0561 [Allokutzneria albata]